MNAPIPKISEKSELPYWQYDDYRDLLSNEWKLRAIRIPQYSLRAFAKDLKLSPAMISLVLASKAGLSLKRAEKICELLAFSADKTGYFLDLVESIESRSPLQRRTAKDRLRDIRGKLSYRKISLEEFNSIEEWHHPAIFTLSTCENYRPDPVWISKTLGISLDATHVALSRLIQLGLLQPDHAPNIRYGQIGEETPSLSVQKYHREVLGKATAALENQDLECREFLSTFFAIDQKHVPEVKKILQQFNMSLMQDFTQKGTPDRAYCLSLQFFDLQQSPSQGREL